MDYEDEQEQEYEKRPRAGLMVYTRDANGELVFLMMVSSNPKFGGAKPMISKGKIENGESEFTCAVREAEEELGLESSNLAARPMLLTRDRVVLRSGTYDLTLYYAPIRDRWDFGKWCDETDYTVWMTLQEFRESGRGDHVKYVEMLVDLIGEEQK